MYSSGKKFAQEILHGKSLAHYFPRVAISTLWNNNVTESSWEIFQQGMA